MRRTSMIAIAASVLIGAGMTASSRYSPLLAAGPTTGAAADAKLQEKSFTDSKSSVELRVPKGWVQKQGIEDTGFEAPAKDRVEAGGLAPNIVLRKDAAPGIKPSDVDAIVAGKRKQYAKTFPGYKDEAACSVLPHIPGKGVGRIDYSFVVSDVLPVRGVQIWIVDKDRVYTITCTSLSDTYVKNGKVFDAVFGTITVP